MVPRLCLRAGEATRVDETMNIFDWGRRRKMWSIRSIRSRFWKTIRIRSLNKIRIERVRKARDKMLILTKTVRFQLLRMDWRTRFLKLTKRSWKYRKLWTGNLICISELMMKCIYPYILSTQSSEFLHTCHVHWLDFWPLLDWIKNVVSQDFIILDNTTHLQFLHSVCYLSLLWLIVPNQPGNLDC